MVGIIIKPQNRSLRRFLSFRNKLTLLPLKTYVISLDELNPQVGKFLHRVNRGLGRSDLLKRYGHDTPAETPKDEAEVQDIHAPTESDEEQDAGARDAEVDKLNIQWEEVTEEPAEVQWDEVSEDGYLVVLNFAQLLKYDPFRSIHEEYLD